MRELHSNWKEVKLGNIVYFNPKESLIKGKIYKKVSMDCLKPKTREIIKYELDKFKGGSKFRNGDTLFARITPCLENGKIAQVSFLDNKEIGFGSTEFIVLREKENITLNDYIYYLFITDKIKNIAIKSMTGTSGRQRVQEDVLKYTIVKLPPLAEQKRIASILSSFDDKIELNNKTNKILEEMAQTIFKEWFINFNFPNEDGKPYKKSGGEMIGSELGKIPKGWKVGTIGDLISNLFNGDWGKDKNKEKYTKEVICIRGADIGDIFKGFDGNPVRRFILEKNLKSKKLLEGDIVMECSGGSPTQSTGRCIFVTKSLLSAYDKPLICTNFCKVIKIKEKEYRGYAYNLLWYLYNTRLFFLFENGTTGIKNLDVNNLFKRHMIAIPDIDVALEYNEIFLSLIDIMHANKKENEKLSNIRDSLLPKLMTPNGRRADGEIRVNGNGNNGV